MKFSEAQTHWRWNGEDVETTEMYGFAYQITNLTKNKRYIGRKAFKIGKGKRQRNSNWKRYAGSSPELTDDIKAGDKCEYNILSFHKSRRSLHYAEIHYIMVSHALVKAEFYNKVMKNSIRFSVPDEVLKELRG